MTRAEALTTLRALAQGLRSDYSGEVRLPELIAVHDATEELRAVVFEIGIRALLDADGLRRRDPTMTSRSRVAR